MVVSTEKKSPFDTVFLLAWRLNIAQFFWILAISLVFDVECVQNGNALLKTYVTFLNYFNEERLHNILQSFAVILEMFICFFWQMLYFSTIYF